MSVMTDAMSDATNEARDRQAAGAPEARETPGGEGRPAREQARAMTGEAREQARHAAHDLRESVTGEADDQAHRTAGTLHRWADELAEMAQHAPDNSPTRELVASAAHNGHRAADYLDERGVGGLAQDVRGFAQRSPAAFLGGAALAGFAVGRLVKAGRAGPADGPAAGDGGPQRAGEG
jgi:hypothetical protein